MNGEKQEGRHTKDVQYAFSTVDKRLGIGSEESALWNQAKALAAIADVLEAALPLLEKIANPLVPVDGFDITEALAEGKVVTLQGPAGGGGSGRGRYQGVEGMNEEPGQ